jgi:multimeric flavodoxin WrbA
LATPDDVEWADAVIFGTPNRFGKVSAQLKQFTDTLGGLRQPLRHVPRQRTGQQSGGRADP